MTAHPWMKFYPRDWRGDQALRAVSISARGLWMECLCIMHEAKPYGHLVLNGEPIEDGVLARMTGVSVDEVSALMAELRQAGVLSVTGRGVVFSRRMVDDFARAQKGRKAVQKRYTQDTENKEKKEPPSRSPSRTPTTQKPEARYQKPDRDDLFESENLSGDGSGEPRQMAFVGKIIRLTFADFERWRKSYSAITDLRAELEAADAYYAETPPKDGKWFFPVSNWLKRENEKQRRQEIEERGSRATWN